LLVPVGTFVLLRGAAESVHELLVMLELVVPLPFALVLPPNMPGAFQKPNGALGVPIEGQVG
jgi:hypothetical protein